MDYPKRRFSVFGDSISTFEGSISEGNRCYYGHENAQDTCVESKDDTWWMQVIGALGAELLANASFSGSMVAGAGFPAGRSKERASQILGEDGAVPDDVLVFIGINDYGWGDAQAQLACRSEARPLCVDVTDIPKTEPGHASDDALSVFEEAYAEMLHNILEVAPKARVWCITLIPGRLGQAANNTFCYSLRGLDIDAYNAAIRRAASRVGCEVADIRALGYDYRSIDGTHPDSVGMSQIASMVTDAILRRVDQERMQGYSDNRTSVLSSHIPQYLESERTCDKPNCIGCEYAQGTGCAWSCVCNQFLRQ